MSMSLTDNYFLTSQKNNSHIECNKDIECIHSPFKVFRLRNLLNIQGLYRDLHDELLSVSFVDKNNDLYRFKQTTDLKNVDRPFINTLRHLVYNEIKAVVSNITGVTFNDEVALTCSRYDHTDTLLCHDDWLEGRRVAFVLYLSPDWAVNDGGTLDLFDMDEHGRPRAIVQSLVPEYNSLVCFEVTHGTYHQVSEVLTDKCRLSVNGWYHGNTLPRAPPYRCATPMRYPATSVDDVNESTVRAWINPTYLDVASQAEIQSRFENDSEIELQDFLQEEKYASLVKALKGLTFEMRGPADQRRYEVATNFSQEVDECLSIFRNEAFFLVLSNLTGLSLHALAQNSTDDSRDLDSDGSYTGADVSSSRAEDSVNAGEDDQRSSTCDGTAGGSDLGERKRKRDSDGDSASPEEKKQRAVISSVPTCSYEVRRWSHGCYSMITDAESELEFTLDVMLFIDADDWDASYGGYCSYVARNEDEELLTVTPRSNALAVIYKEKDTARFVKYIDSRVKRRRDEGKSDSFYDLSFVYCE